MTFDEVLASIQDPGAKALIADAQAKAARLAELEGQLAGKHIVDQSTVNEWTAFDVKWKGGLREKAENAVKIAAENARLQSEIARLKPEAERAAILAKQIEGGEGIDPNKILEMGDARYAGKFIPVDQIDSIVQRAVKEAKQAVDFGTAPTLAKMVDYQNRAYREYGLTIPSEQMGDAVSKYGGFDQAYAALTADKAREKAAADEAERAKKYQADVEAARREGFEKARNEFETNKFVGEEGGMSGVIPMIPSKPEDAGVNPTTYDPSQGILARQYADKAKSFGKEPVM